MECEAAEKFSATGAQKQDVPFAVYSNFNFMKTELESGWFAIQVVPDDKDDYGQKKLTRVCWWDKCNDGVRIWLGLVVNS